MSKKNLDTLVQDIYKALEPLSESKPLNISEKDLDTFADDMKEAYFYIANANTEAFKRIFLEDEWKRIKKTAHHLKFANPFVKSFCYNN